MTGNYKYNIVYRFIDYDAKTKVEYFNTWKETCKFMKKLLDDGYLILGVNG